MGNASQHTGKNQANLATNKTEHISVNKIQQHITPVEVHQLNDKQSNCGNQEELQHDGNTKKNSSQRKTENH